jgi:hypothetical protein
VRDGLGDSDHAAIEGWDHPKSEQRCGIISSESQVYLAHVSYLPSVYCSIAPDVSKGDATA